MILDDLNQWRTYAALSPRFEKAFAFLRQMTDATPVRRHEIDGDDVFALVQQYVTQPAAERAYESHRKYIDIQYLQRGREVMGWAPLSHVTTVTMPYTGEKDAALYAPIPTGVPVRVQAGQFTIFYPEDAHLPGCAWDEPADVLKVVIKVRV